MLSHRTLSTQFAEGPRQKASDAERKRPCNRSQRFRKFKLTMVEEAQLRISAFDQDVKIVYIGLREYVTGNDVIRHGSRYVHGAMRWHALRVRPLLCIQIHGQRT